MTSPSGTARGPPPGAPPKKGLSKAKQAAWEALGKDPAALKKIIESVQASKSFDPNSAAVRMARDDGNGDEPAQTNAEASAQNVRGSHSSAHKSMIKACILFILLNPVNNDPSEEFQHAYLGYGMFTLSHRSHHIGDCEEYHVHFNTA